MQRTGVEWNAVEWSAMQWSGVHWSWLEWSGLRCSGVGWMAVTCIIMEWSLLGVAWRGTCGGYNYKLVITMGVGWGPVVVVVDDDGPHDQKQRNQYWRGPGQIFTYGFVIGPHK